MIRPCPLISPRLTAFIAGAINLAIGLSGVSLIGLTPKERHTLLDPLEPTTLDRVKYNDVVVEDTLQLFIEFILPSVGISLLGFVLIVGAVLLNQCMIVFSFLLSIIIIAGCSAGLLSLSTSGVDLLGALPLILVALLQFYIFWIVIDFNQFYREGMRKEDTRKLVGKSDTTV